MSVKYLLECLSVKGFLFPSTKTQQTPIYLVIIIAISIISIVISESLLAFFVFNELCINYNYSASNAALLSSGLFFIQFLLTAGLASYFIKKLVASNTIFSVGQNAIKSIALAFAAGFNSKKLIADN